MGENKPAVYADLFTRWYKPLSGDPVNEQRAINKGAKDALKYLKNKEFTEKVESNRATKSKK